MSTSTSRTKASALAAVQAIIAGTQKHFPTGSLTFGNATYQSSSLVQTLTGLANAMQAYAVAQVTAKDERVALEAQEATVDPILSDYRKFLTATFGQSAQILADFGLTPAKARKPLTVEAMSEKVALGNATRKARGTMGKAKRSKIHGTVPATTGEEPVQPVAVSGKAPAP
jgi:hypothetical protein